MSRKSMFALIVVLVLQAGGATAAPPLQPAQVQYWQALDEAGSQGYLGVNIGDVDADLARSLDLPEERGARIADVQEDGPAAGAGFERGDVVMTWNGVRVEGMRQLQRLVAETPPGREVEAEVFRNGSLEALRVTVGNRGDAATASSGWPPGVDLRSLAPGWPGPRSWQGGLDDDAVEPAATQRPKLGVELLPLSSQLAAFFGLEDGSGVLVASVLEGSAAEQAGLRAGDILLEIDDEPVDLPADVIRSIARKEGLIDLRILRDKAEMPVAAELTSPEEGEGDEAEEPPVYPRDAM